MAKSLRDLRKNRKLTIKALAGKAGCSAHTISEYETNPPPTADRRIVESIAKCLDVTPEYILSLMGSTASAPSSKNAKGPASTAKPKETVASAPGRTARKKDTVRPPSAPRKNTRPRRGAGLMLNQRQRSTLAGLLDERISKLRVYVLEAGRTQGAENGPLTILAQDASRDIQALEEIKNLLLHE